MHVLGFDVFPFCGTLPRVRVDEVDVSVITPDSAATERRSTLTPSLPLLQIVPQLTPDPGGGHSARFQRLRSTLREEWLQGRESKRRFGRARV